MAGNMTSYLENKILDHIFNGVEYIPPSTLYVGLVDSGATDLDLENGVLNNEITDYIGDRKEINFNLSSQENGKGTSKNNSEINFNGMPKKEVAFAILCDSATGGNILFWLPADTIKTTNIDDIYRLKENDVTITLD
jgi:hypothetical protein